NVQPDSPPKTFSFVAPAPTKPQLIKLGISVAGRERFSTGGMGRSAAHYILQAEIGGIKGRIAPLVGKQPAHPHARVLEGEAPAFVKSEQPFYFGGPLWRIELVSPAFPKSANGE